MAISGSIFARSPYIITINSAGQIETKLEIFLWNGTGSMPLSPTYTLSKKIPASNAPSTYYDISNYIREFISHTTNQTVTTLTNNPTAQYCNVGLKLYKKTSTAFTQVGSTQTYKAFEGFTYYTEGYNFSLYRVHLDEGTYNYFNNGSGNLGHITIETDTGDSIRYTNLSTGATQTISLTASSVQDIPRVHSTYLAVGNKVELLNGGSTLWTGTFQPKAECKYTPVRCDFVNRYGAWQREYFFKASNTSINMENTEYNLMQKVFPNYSILEGQRKVFNTNLKQQIKVNTDWVKESYSEVIKQIIGSERILLDNTPVKINTKSTELFKSINTHMINYQLDFEYAYDIINSVV
jgi:hypothetical protein